MTNSKRWRTPTTTGALRASPAPRAEFGVARRTGELAVELAFGQLHPRQVLNEERATVAGSCARPVAFLLKLLALAAVHIVVLAHVCVEKERFAAHTTRVKNRMWPVVFTRLFL